MLRILGINEAFFFFWFWKTLTQVFQGQWPSFLLLLAHSLEHRKDARFYLFSEGPATWGLPHLEGFGLGGRTQPWKKKAETPMMKPRSTNWGLHRYEISSCYIPLRFELTIWVFRVLYHDAAHLNELGPHCSTGLILQRQGWISGGPTQMSTICGFPISTESVAMISQGEILNARICPDVHPTLQLATHSMGDQVPSFTYYLGVHPSLHVFNGPIHRIKWYAQCK